MKNILINLQVQTEKTEYEKTRSLALFNNIPDGVIAIDLQGAVTYMTPSAEVMFRWSPAEAVGRLLYNCIPLSDVDCLLPVRRRPIQIAMTTGRLFTTTLEDAPIFMRRDYTQFSVSISAAPIIIDEVVGGIAIFHDITREKELDHAKSEFISIASHQLRTPLSTITWYTDALPH